MPVSVAREPLRPAVPPWTVLGTGVVIALLALAAYANSFSGPFIFDDPSSIGANPTIRQLWPLSDVLTTPRVGVTVGGRPVLNLSLAINYAFGGNDVRGYHVGNLLIHIVAALALFGLIRRTLIRVGEGSGRALPMGDDRKMNRTGVALNPDHALWLAAAVAGLWAVHPLQTESITYVIQRAESLMGMFYLLTLYAFVRGVEAIGKGAARGWYTFAAIACLLGMGTKEVMVSAPVLVLLYDRTFVAGTFREAIRRRGIVHGALFPTWCLLGYLVASTGGTRGGSAGFGVGVGWWDYVLTQFEAIALYVRLAIWPRPLVFEYGTFWVARFTEVLPGALVVLALVTGTVWAFWRRPAIGFLGVFFFAILSVTSLVPGTTQMIVEHRMYLPLAPVLLVFVGLAHVWLGRWSRGLFVVAIVAAIFVTHQRNTDYRSELAIWSDTVAKRPRNALAHEMLAQTLAKIGRYGEAVAAHERALALNPDFAIAHSSLGDDLFRLRRIAEAITHYEKAVRLRPDYVDAHHGLAIALAGSSRAREAVVHFDEALRLKPDFAEGHFSLANTLAAAGEKTAAFEHYETTLRLKPDFAEAHYNYANALAEAGRTAEAVAHYEAALKTKPDYASAHYNLANTLVGLGRRRDALAHYESAVTARPDYFDALVNLGSALYEEGRVGEAATRYEAALRLRPDSPELRDALTRLRAAK